MDIVTQYARDLLDSAPDAMVIADAQGVIALVNVQTETLFGYRREELIGQPLEVLMPERFRNKHPQLSQSYVNEPRARPMGVDLNLYARRRDGSEFPVEISLSPLKTAQGLLISSAIRDVTDRKLVHEQLAAARAEADRANRAKSSFLAAASHNLRQPLQTLTLLNAVLERTVCDAAALSRIAAQGAALASVSGLLNALLDISKLESGAIQPDIKDCSVQTIFQHLKATFEAQAQAKGLSLVVDDADCVIRTDKGLFEQIVQNLVANAIRYTREGMVRLRCLHEAAFVRIEVLDTGIGIAADQQGAIFDEFYQVNRESGEKREGFGLGLAMVRRMAQLLGHAIEIQSDVGRGSRFTVTAPRGGSVFAPEPNRVAQATGLRAGQARVMVIDDDLAVAASTKMLLKLEGYRVDVAATMQEAMSCNEQDSWPDVIVADYHLDGGGSGIQVIGDLRTLARRSIPAVLITGDTSADVVKALAGLDGCKVLSKPFVPNDFLAVVKQLLADSSGKI